MQKGFVPIVIILAFIAAVGLGILGYYLNKQQTLKNINSFDECARYFSVMESYPAQCNTSDGRHFVQELSDEEKEKLQLTVESSNSAETADWKTYTSKKVGYSIKVPPGWEMEQQEDDSLLSNQDYVMNMTFYPDGIKGIPTRLIGISFPISIRGPHKDLGRQFEQGLDKLGSVKEEPAEWYSEQKSYFIKVDGYKALVKLTTFKNEAPSNFRGGWCECTYKHVYIDLANSNVLDIEGYWANNYTNFEEVFDKIISTIQFLK